jgi:hypothetical protein
MRRSRALWVVDDQKLIIHLNDHMNEQRIIRVDFEV